MKIPPKLAKDKITTIQTLFQKTERKDFNQNYSIKQPASFKIGYTIEELGQKNDEELDKILGQFVDFREYFQLEEKKKHSIVNPMHLQTLNIGQDKHTGQLMRVLL